MVLPDIKVIDPNQKPLFVGIVAVNVSGLLKLMVSEEICRDGVGGVSPETFTMRMPEGVVTKSVFPSGETIIWASFGGSFHHWGEEVDSPTEYVPIRLKVVVS